MLLPIQTTWINNNYNKQARVTKQSYRMESQDKFTKEPTVNYQFMKFMKKNVRKHLGIMFMEYFFQGR